MITIYHNPRCRKSREGLELLENSGQDYSIVKYLEDTLSEDELKHIITKLDINPIDLVRTKETIWKQEFKNKELSDNAIIKAMVAHPKLIERPIVIKGNQAVIGRPKEKILDIIK